MCGWVGGWRGRAAQCWTLAAAGRQHWPAVQATAHARTARQSSRLGPQLPPRLTGLAALQRRQLAPQVAHGGVEAAPVQVAPAGGPLDALEDLWQRVGVQHCWCVVGCAVRRGLAGRRGAPASSAAKVGPRGCALGWALRRAGGLDGSGAAHGCARLRTSCVQCSALACGLACEGGGDLDRRVDAAVLACARSSSGQQSNQPPRSLACNCCPSGSASHLAAGARGEVTQPAPSLAPPCHRTILALEGGQAGLWVGQPRAFARHRLVVRALVRHHGCVGGGRAGGCEARMMTAALTGWAEL